MASVLTKLQIKHKFIDGGIAGFSAIFGEANTIIFFTGRLLNRLPLKEDRNQIGNAGYKLIKTNNFRLKSVLLSQNILKSLSQFAYSYTLVALGTQDADLKNLQTVFSLPYKHIKPFLAITKKTFFNKQRIEAVKMLPNKENISIFLKEKHPAFLFNYANLCLYNIVPHLVELNKKYEMKC